MCHELNVLIIDVTTNLVATLFPYRSVKGASNQGNKVNFGVKSRDGGINLDAPLGSAASPAPETVPTVRLDGRSCVAEFETEDRPVAATST